MVKYINKRRVEPASYAEKNGTIKESIEMKPIIEVIGLGGGDIHQLPLGLYRKLIDTKDICYVRTIDHPVISSLEEEGVVFESFDTVYEKHDQFEAVYQEIVDRLINQALKKEPNSLCGTGPSHVSRTYGTALTGT